MPDRDEYLEDFWDGYEGICQACDAYGPVDDLSLCDSCTKKFERDMIRLRKWDFSANAFRLAVEQREELRCYIIKEFGEKLELIAPMDAWGT